MYTSYPYSMRILACRNGVFKLPWRPNDFSCTATPRVVCPCRWKITEVSWNHSSTFVLTRVISRTNNVLPSAFGSSVQPNVRDSRLRAFMSPTRSSICFFLVSSSSSRFESSFSVDAHDSDCRKRKETQHYARCKIKHSTE